VILLFYDENVKIVRTVSDGGMMKIRYRVAEGSCTPVPRT
jgi:hypothetical protein